MPLKIQNQKGNQSYFMIGFLIINNFYLLHYSNCFIDIEPLNP